MNYPRAWVVDRHLFWNEQYFVQAFLTFNDRFQVVWGSSGMHLDRPEVLEAHFEAYDRATAHPASLWIRRRGD